MEAPDFIDISRSEFFYGESFVGCDEHACLGIELSYIFGSFKNYETIDPSFGDLVVPDDVLALRIG